MCDGGNVMVMRLTATSLPYVGDDDVDVVIDFFAFNVGGVMLLLLPMMMVMVVMLVLLPDV